MDKDLLNFTLQEFIELYGSIEKVIFTFLSETCKNENNKIAQ